MSLHAWHWRCANHCNCSSPPTGSTAATAATAAPAACRIWDTNHILQKTVVRPTTPSASRVGVTACAYNSDGKLLAAGMLDGGIQVRGVHNIYRL